MKDIATLSTTKYILDKYNLNALKKYYTDIQEKENMEHIKPEKKLSLQLLYRIVEQQVQEI